MKSISIEHQRKLYTLFEKAVDQRMDYQIHAEFGFKSTPDITAIHEQGKEDKRSFLSFLEDGVIKKPAT